MNLSVKSFMGIAPKVWAFLHQAEQIGGIRIGDVDFSNHGGRLEVKARLDEDAAGDGAAADAIRAIAGALGLEVKEVRPYASKLFASGYGMSVSVSTQVAGVSVRLRAIVDADDTARTAVTGLLKAAAA